MRVISGTCRGRKLSVPPGIATRPTSDRVKEALFSILTSRIDVAELHVLDICAGTGSLGIEALSRGASHCCFIECNLSLKTILSKNLIVTNNLNHSDIIIMDAVKAIRAMAGRGKVFDLVFFDPPYDAGLYQGVLEALDSSGMLRPGSILVAECSARNCLLEAYGRLKRFDRRVYGQTALELFALEE